MDTGVEDKRTKGCRTGVMQDRMDARLEGCRTGGMQYRRDAGQ